MLKVKGKKEGRERARESGDRVQHNIALLSDEKNKGNLKYTK